MTIRWEWKLLSQMKPIELYRVMQHRGKVFAVEQQQAYLDADDKDIDAWHLLGWDENNQLIVYARVLLPTTTDEFVRFGRLSVSAEHRNHGYGNKAVQEIFNWIMHSEYKHHPIQIAAQTHLVKMYEKCGFVCHGEVFNMGTLPHIRMTHPALV